MTAGDASAQADQRSVDQARQVERGERDHRRDLLVTLAVCMGWALLGLLAVMWSVHTTNVRHGWIAVYAGLVVGNGGVVGTLIIAIRRRHNRGDA